MRGALPFFKVFLGHVAYSVQCRSGNVHQPIAYLLICAGCTNHIPACQAANDIPASQCLLIPIRRLSAEPSQPLTRWRLSLPLSIFAALLHHSSRHLIWSLFIRTKFAQMVIWVESDGTHFQRPKHRGSRRSLGKANRCR